MTRIHFMVNGLGLGNSTRCHAVIQRLHNKGVSISVSTSGNGLWYFKGRPEVDCLTELKALAYGASKGKISIGKTILSIPKAAAILKSNNRKLMQTLEERPPDVVVTDSEYNFRPFKRLGIPIIALNNSDVVVQSFNHFPLKPPEIFTQFYAIEKTDYLYHKWIPDKVLSPSLEPFLPGIHKKFHRIPPIVRKECVSGEISKNPTKVAIMLSGSVFGSPVRISHPPPLFEIDILGRNAPQDVQKTKDIRYHSRVKDSLPLLSSADLVVINGGFSAVSEAFMMRKPIVVIPVPRHAEQWINGKTIEKLGVGIMATEPTLESAMYRASNNLERFQKAYNKLPQFQNGSKEAAEQILRFVRQ